MSYAAAASKNRLPEDQQPHPDPALLEGSHSDESDTDLSHSTATDEKVHVVTREEFEEDRAAFEEEVPVHRPEPVRLTSSDAPATLPSTSSTTASAPPSSEETKKAAQETKQEAKKAAQDTKQAAQETKETAKDKAANAYAQGEKAVEKGKEDAKREYNELSEKAKKAYDRLSEEARRDWHKLSKESKKKWEEAKNSDAGQELQKPEVWGSLLGLANLAVAGTTIYYAYSNWHKPRWDRRVVTATVIGLATWISAQGYLVPQTDAVKQRRR